MNARDILHTEAAPVSRKPPLGENRPRPVLVWENPELTADRHKEKSKASLNLVSGQTLYTYVLNDPIGRIDPFGLSDIAYDNNAGTLTVTDGNGNVVGTYPAGNNAQNGSRGPWQGGTYNYDYHTTHPDDAPDSAYGSNGNFVFDVPGCVGCGVHSGRANRTDRAGRSGAQYATNGCIRTTDEATSEIERLIHNGDPLRTLTVVR